MKGNTVCNCSFNCYLDPLLRIGSNREEDKYIYFGKGAKGGEIKKGTLLNCSKTALK